jgi:hypothetical protein
VPGDDRLGLTIINADFQSVHTSRSHTQKIRSVGLSLSCLGPERRKTVSCCRRAMFSSLSSAELLNIDARARTALNKVCVADQRNRRKSINFNDYRSIRVFWMDSQGRTPRSL